MDGSARSVLSRLAAVAVFALTLPLGCTSTPEAKAPSDDKSAEEDGDKGAESADAKEGDVEDRAGESADNDEATPDEAKPDEATPDEATPDEAKPDENYPPPPT